METGEIQELLPLEIAIISQTESLRVADIVESIATTAERSCLPKIQRNLVFRIDKPVIGHDDLVVLLRHDEFHRLPNTPGVRAVVDDANRDGVLLPATKFVCHVDQERFFPWMPGRVRPTVHMVPSG